MRGCFLFKSYERNRSEMDLMINQSELEQLLAPYAKAPVEYPESVDPVLKNYMRQQHRKIKKFPNFIDAWLLLLEGQIRVIYTVLCQNNIPATVKHGSLDWSNKQEFPPSLTLHLWIDVEPYRIDYRGRNWYEFNSQHEPLIEQVPYGVFIPSDFPFVTYQFKRVEQIRPVK